MLSTNMFENSELDLDCKNPKFFEPMGLIFFLFSVVLIFFITNLQLRLLPETGKIATHWGANGKPNGWQSVENFKLTWQLIVYGTLSVIWAVFILCYFFPDIYNKKASRWICEKLRISKLRNWTVTNISILGALTVMNVCLGIFFISVTQMVITANESINKELPILPMFIYLLIPILLLTLFTILWEPTKSN